MQKDTSAVNQLTRDCLGGNRRRRVRLGSELSRENRVPWPILPIAERVGESSASAQAEKETKKINVTGWTEKN